MQSGPVPFSDFAVHVAPIADGGTDVSIFGEFDVATVDRVRSALSDAIAAEGPVVVDLRACGFVDSRGIGSLVEVALRLREQGRRLSLKGVQPRVMRILEIAGLASSELLVVEPEHEPKTD